MSRATKFGNLISIQSVVDRWKEVKSEHVERWREIVISNCETERKLWSPITGGDNGDFFDNLHRVVPAMEHWQSEEPPEFEFHTGIVLTEQQRKDFNNGDSKGVQCMANSFVNDAFGGLLSTDARYRFHTHPVEPSGTQVARYIWHRDRTDFVVFVTNALPMKLLYGAMSPDFREYQNNAFMVSLGKPDDLDLLSKVDQWAKEQGRLVEMHTNEIAIDVSRSWHCPAINATQRPVSRAFLRGSYDVGSANRHVCD